MLPGIGNKIHVLILRRGIANKPEIELAHAGIVIVKLRYDDLIDKFKVHTGRKALLGAEQDTVPAFPQRLPAGRVSWQMLCLSR